MNGGVVRTFVPRFASWFPHCLLEGHRSYQGSCQIHRCPFWLFWSKKKFTWWFNHVPGPSISPKRTPMVRYSSHGIQPKVPRQTRSLLRLPKGPAYWWGSLVGSLAGYCPQPNVFRLFTLYEQPCWLLAVLLVCCSLFSFQLPFEFQFDVFIFLVTGLATLLLVSSYVSTSSTEQSIEQNRPDVTLPYGSVLSCRSFAWCQTPQ